jgi:thiol-disulfide isomerase/thioredoxin
METIICLTIIYIILIIINYYNVKKENPKEETIQEVIQEVIHEAIEEKINKNKEEFKQKKNVYIFLFLSKSCPPCVNYDKNIHDKVVQKFENNDSVKIQKIYSESDSENLFDKHDIQYTPTCCVIDVETDKATKTNGVTPEQIEATVDTVQNN